MRVESYSLSGKRGSYRLWIRRLDWQSRQRLTMKRWGNSHTQKSECLVIRDPREENITRRSLMSRRRRSKLSSFFMCSSSINFFSLLDSPDIVSFERESLIHWKVLCFSFHSDTEMKDSQSLSFVIEEDETCKTKNKRSSHYKRIDSIDFMSKWRRGLSFNLLQCLCPSFILCSFLVWTLWTLHAKKGEKPSS